MNKILIALVVMGACMSGVAAQADTLLIERHAYGYSFEGTNYRFNEQDGTAWMIVGLSEDLGSPDIGIDGHGYAGPVTRHETVVASVQGLSYDAPAAQILFTGTAGKIVCATVTEKHGVFGMKSIITPTGACRTFTKIENRGESVYFEAK